MSKKCQIVLGATSMEITIEPIASNPTELIKKSNIVAVYPVSYNKNPKNGEIRFKSPSGLYRINETITGGTSGATAVFKGYAGNNTLILQNITGNFSVGETLTGGTSTTTSTAVSANQVSTMSADKKYNNEWLYPYNSMTEIDVRLQDGTGFRVELQDVTNQAAWSTGTLAGLNQAISDINAWL